ncbi:hypothetical protein BpHYR1_050136 [Brachionus plicatilis]|uniref:Uncharacterized protein n=1 Tax=Brachionus plicatilis TaxID=10195 RepID=A0A3M7RKD2_BRAPC|nr:hypothetical protein BpHYR1_050136 [Brachionus plicatilis]
MKLSINSISVLSLELVLQNASADTNSVSLNLIVPNFAIKSLDMLCQKNFKRQKNLILNE